MKKFGFFVVFSMLICTNAFAACTLLNTTNSRCNENDNEVLEVLGMGCYVCENGYCGSGHMLAVAGQGRVKGSGGATYNDTIFSCKRGGFGYDDRWSSAGKIPWCAGADSRKNDQNAYKKLFNIKKGMSYDITTGASVSVAAASDVCFDYECKTGYTRVDGQPVCVKLNAQCTDKDGKKHTTGTGIVVNCLNANADSNYVGKLTSTSHVKSDGMCKASCEDTGWDLQLTDTACDSGYAPNTQLKRCVKTQQTINNENAAAALRNKCVKSGGTWSGGRCKCDAAKNLRLDNGECVCTDSNYKRDGDKCVLTEPAQLKRDCEAAASTGAYWDNGECKCENPQHEWRNKKCQLKADIAECNKITGAHWVNNECKCTNPNMVINDEQTKCVLSATFTATQTVNSVYSQLTSIHNKFRDDVSVWKNEEGKFNTARLASDSIAGVVLGTAGGLITSSVVKKNQVENGFEDIKCTIGGQNVAEWGDQFRVGIQ